MATLRIYDQPSATLSYLAATDPRLVPTAEGISIVADSIGKTVSLALNTRDLKQIALDLHALFSIREQRSHG